MRVLPSALAGGAVLLVLLGGCAGTVEPLAAPSATASPTGTPRTSSSPVPTALAYRTLTVHSVPSGAQVEAVGADGAVVAGTAPFQARVTGGRVALTVRHDGYADVGRTLDVTSDRELTVWLDRPGQLLTSQVRWDSGARPKQVAFSPDGREVWATLLGGSGVQVFDSGSGQRLGQVELGRHGAVEVIFTRDGRTAYASQMETASVYEIDTATRSVRRRMAGGGTWSKVMALAPDEGTLYLANWSSNDVSEIDLATGAVRRRIHTVRTPRGLFVTPDGKRLYVAGYSDGEIQVIDLDTGDARVLIRTGGAMRHLVGDAAGTRLYASDMATGTVHAVDLGTEAVTALAKVDANPNTIDLSPDGKVLFVSCRGRNGTDYERPGPEWGSVVLVDTTSGRLLDAIVGGNQTTGLDVSAEGTLLAFSDFLDDRISVYAVPPYEVLAVGGGGRAGAHRGELAKR